ncbi:MAG: hypothetical protein IPH76_16250 [Xanthomonadales bacterium]|nr:hypothetical protein [Xanthomonadales bacterium]
MTRDLSEEGGAFASAWYADRYVAKYREALALHDDTPDALAAAEDSPGNQRIVDGFLDAAHGEWKIAATLPSRQQLLARATAALTTVMEAAGFTPSASTQWSADAETAEYVRRGDGFLQLVRLRSFDYPLPGGRGLGIDLALETNLKSLGALVYTEGRTDLPHDLCGRAHGFRSAGDPRQGLDWPASRYQSLAGLPGRRRRGHRTAARLARPEAGGLRAAPASADRRCRIAGCSL